MVKSYNLTEYGAKLEEIRNALGLTRVEVAKKSRISKDTLYKLEKGQSLPKYDTLEILSDFYRMDLLAMLMQYRTSSALYKFFTQLEFLTAEYDETILKTLKVDFQDVRNEIKEKEDLVDIRSFEQFDLIIQGITLYYEDKNPLCFDYFVKAIQKVLPEFTIENFDTFRYDFLGIRNLSYIAQGLFVNRRYLESNKIQTFIIDKFDLDLRAPMTEKMMIIKSYYNISYNAHMLDDHHTAHYYATKGIDYCKKHHMHYILPSLLYRKGISEFLLGNDQYMIALEQSLNILSALGNDHLKNKFIEVTKTNYQIDLG